MRIVQYTPEMFAAVQSAARRMEPGVGLIHRPFVDHYYATRPECKLYLCVDDVGTVLGSFGVELMPFQYGDRCLTLGCGTNFHALQKGVGGLLYLQILQASPISLMYGGSEDSNRLFRSQGWTYYPGLRTLFLNRILLPWPGDPRWRRKLKRVLNRINPRVNLTRLAARLQRGPAAGLAVREEHAYSEDLLLRHSPLTLRFVPDVDYLTWRYGLGLKFVQYRLFRITAGEATIGYVILRSTPDRLIVGHCDGDDPTTLAYGILLSLGAASRGDRRPREVMATSSHSLMQRIFKSVGFETSQTDIPLAMKSLRQSDQLPTPDTSNWLINHDWGDNGLTAPFPDQEVDQEAPSASASNATTLGPV
jgi:hypothetical protein